MSILKQFLYVPFSMSAQTLNLWNNYILKNFTVTSRNFCIFSHFSKFSMSLSMNLVLKITFVRFANRRSKFASFRLALSKLKGETKRRRVCVCVNVKTKTNQTHNHLEKFEFPLTSPYFLQNSPILARSFANSFPFDSHSYFLRFFISRDER